MRYMDIDTSKYLKLQVKNTKAPPHEKAAVVDVFLDFIGNNDAAKYPYTFWLKKVGKCSYGQALDIIKSLEHLPIKYNKAGTVVNKLKKLNGK
jgi:hypothetical protein